MKKTLSALMICTLLLCAAVTHACAEEPPFRIPALSRLATAELVYIPKEGDEALILGYAPATQEDVQYLLTICAMLGSYAKCVETDGSLYALKAPGNDCLGILAYDQEEEILILQLDEDTSLVKESTVDNLLDFLSTDVKLPADATGNVAPQFYAAVNRQPYKSCLTGSSLFDEQMHWTEFYDMIDNDLLMRYTQLMTLFGFQASMNFTSVVEEGEYTSLLYSNGEAEIIVSYDAARQSAIVDYKPGVSYTLLDGGDLNDALN